jgi:hypothetical protein
MLIEQMPYGEVVTPYFSEFFCKSSWHVVKLDGNAKLPPPALSGSSANSVVISSGLLQRDIPATPS